jgi:hypothetical protein
MKSNSFTLTELLVYMSILSFFSLFIFDYWCIVQKSTSTVGVPLVTLDLLRRDIAQSSNTENEWILDGPELVFKKKRLNSDGTIVVFDVGWKIDKERLVRSNGIYDFRGRRWIEKRSAVVEKEARSIRWKIFKNKSGVEVERAELLYVPKNGERTEIIVRLRNRKLEQK